MLVRSRSSASVNARAPPRSTSTPIGRSPARMGTPSQRRSAIEAGTGSTPWRAHSVS